LDLVRRNTDTFIIHSTSRKHAMNTMNTTAEFANRTAPDAANAFLPALGKKLLGLLCMTAAVQSADKALLAERIVLE
jgi:hypothetical protein